MLQLAFLALFYSLIAGVMNGSFALPTKYIKTWNFENTWFMYGVWAFLILPWVFVFGIDPRIGHVYRMLPRDSMLILLIGGFLFGVGQVCFAIALDTIGIGLGFVINIGLGTALGVLIPLVTLHPDKIFTSASLTSLFGLTLILIGLLISYHAGSERDRQRTIGKSMSSTANQIPYKLSVFLAILAGIFSAGENYTFAATSNIQKLALHESIGSFAASIVIWPPFLFFSFLPYMAYMIFLHIKNKSRVKYQSEGSWKNGLLSLVMGFFWFGSLALYSKAALLIGDLGPVIIWPLFMVMIILTSNFWSWRHHEWADCSPKIKSEALIAVVALVFAVFVLAYSASLSHK